MRISDWSSDVCSSDLPLATRPVRAREPDPPEEPVNDTHVIEIATQTLMIAAKTSAPILLLPLALRLRVSLVQPVTQVQEPTLTFVPTLAGAAAAILRSAERPHGQEVARTCSSPVC